MFITCKEKIGSCYYEFQFCKIKDPLYKGRIKTKNIKYWLEDSLLISDDDFEDFYEKFEEVFNNDVFSNENNEFDAYGINYYDKEAAQKIFLKLKSLGEKKYNKLISWLESDINNYNGFYILGM